MVVFKSCLFAFILCLKASSASANEWTAKIPKSVVGLSGSCVVIPCTYDYPSHGKTYTEFTGIWYKDDPNIIYHKDNSKIISEFKDRTSLIGGLSQKNCTLKISSLKQSDSGSYMFRIEITNLNTYSYQENKPSITVKDSPELPVISVDDEVTSQKKVTATCVVSHSCPSDPPRLTWSHKGTITSHSETQEDGQWMLKSSLTFTPSREDHNKPLSCSAVFSGGKTVANNKNLKVKYPPYNVNIQSKSQVKENESAELICSGVSNPPAHSFQWFSSNKSLLANGPTYRLNHVTRYTGAISCTAINTVGETSSAPHKFNVLYPPEIKKESSCKSEAFVVCVCIVDSNPPSEVKWLGPSSSSQNSSVQQNGSLTIFTLQGWLGFINTVHCSATNSEGNSVMTLSVPHGLVIYLAVAAAVFVVILVAIAACVAKRRCGRRPSQSVMDVKNDHNEMKTTPKSGRRQNNDLYTKYEETDQPVYKNYECDDEHPYEQDEDESIYANT